MRRLIAIALAVAALQIGAYKFLTTMAVDSQGATISQTISLMRVRHRMAKIADAEREEWVTHGECLSFDELADMGKIDKSDAQALGYTFALRCSTELKFDIVGVHAPAKKRSRFHWPVLDIDQDLKFRKPGE